MKYLILLAFISPLVALQLLKLDLKKAVKSVLGDENAENFKIFAEKFGKDYKTSAEAVKRAKVWLNNKARIEQENKRAVGYQLGENLFTDMDDDERKKHLGGNVVEGVFSNIGEYVSQPKTNRTKQGNTRAKRSTSEITYPGWVEDWKQYIYMPPVRNQGGCASCFTFGPINAIEVQMNWVHSAGSSNQFSEQQALDCSGGGDCLNGGYQEKVFNYSIYTGNADQSAYTYTGTQGTCKLATKRKVVTSFKRITKIADMENALYNNGPITCNIRVPPTLEDFASGIFYPDQTTCPVTSTDGHIMSIIGYGTENGVDYWIIRNSWGPAWGEGGYFRMRKGVNNCQIESWVYQPVVA